MSDFVYPSSAALIQIAQDKMPNLVQNREIFKILPMRNVNEALLRWEQKDNYIGLQQVRGLNGAPNRVAKVGAKGYIMQPGVYGEFLELDEEELTTRRALGTFGTPIDISDLVMAAQDQLLNRRLDRIESIGWNILQGTFSVAGPNGAVMHTDTYSPQTFAAGVPWSTYATATPLSDFRAVKLLHLGHSVSFGRDATAYMNQVTANRILLNTNSADLYGRRTAGLGTFNLISEIDTLFAGDDLPKIRIYDDFYIDDSGTSQRFLSTGTVIVVGKRPAGQVIGEYRMTRNINNNNGEPGPYMKVIDSQDKAVPRTVQVHDGHNGGPVIEFASAIVVMSV